MIGHGDKLNRHRADHGGRRLQRVSDRRGAVGTRGAGFLLMKELKVLGKLAELGVPSFAFVNGLALGGGLEIAACCDIRVCGRVSRFGAPIAKLGFPMAPKAWADEVQAKLAEANAAKTQRHVS